MRTQPQTETAYAKHANMQETIRPQPTPKRENSLLCLVLLEYQISTGKFTSAQVLECAIANAMRR